MRRLVAFSNVTLDGFFAGVSGDIRWTQKNHADPEFSAFVADNAKSGGLLVLGRLTCELMASYWPTPLAASQNPLVAERMNAMPKIV